MNYLHTIFIVFILSITSSSHADNSIVISHVHLELYSFQIMAKRILKVAYSRIGKSVEFEKSPSERSIVNANSGITDGELARIGGLEEKYPNLIMIPIPIAYDDVLVYSKNLNFKVEGWSSLLPYNIGYLAGFKLAERRTEGMDIDTVTFAEQGLKKLNRGRTDVFIGLRGIKCLIKKLKLPVIKVIDRPLEKIIMYHYLNKSHSSMAEELETVLMQMKDSGEMESIQKQSDLDFLDQCK